MFDRASAQILFAILLTAVQSCFGVSFRTVKTITVNSGPQAVIFADLTGDTKQDIVVANGLGSSISVILNNGAGWFLPSHTYSVGWGPYAIATGDFNEAGRLDLAVTTTKVLSVLLGNGDGT